MSTKGVILEQAEKSVTHVEPQGGGANPALTLETEGEKTMWQKSSPWVHGVLGVASFVPGLSVVTGAADAALYAAEGDFVEAGIAAASMIPGGKVVTTVGKVAKGAVGMAKGAGTAARIAKGAHEAEEVAKAAKAAKEAEEAARVAREAKAAKEAREAASGPRKPKKEVTVKGREHKVPCFHPFDKKKFMRMSKDEQKAYLKEMALQLKRQEEAINSLTVRQYNQARDLFKTMNRNPAADAAQAELRDRVTADIKKSIGESLLKKGMSPAQAKKIASSSTQEVMSKLAALHEPDMVSGGWLTHEPKGMGRADVNSSIGASWKQSDRIAGMDREANKAIESGRGDQKMNVKLEPCRGKGMR
ncbi:polymorphic toxin type 15 domain-containing protein [Massilia luteola]|uniref:polymorphic toxin type 15 domain-containing protein n=1 Tax=Massilia luteola TaxID=3081751 RepID=UPI002ACC16FC|nr:polymorphic toxin type 15 domain-containing protein [Massilia sp. Gc5]